MKILTKLNSYEDRRVTINLIITEMMKMGFVSLLLELLESSILNICVGKRVAKSFLPCKDIAMEYLSMEPVVFTSKNQSLGFNSPTTLPLLNSEQVDHCESKVYFNYIYEISLSLNLFESHKSDVN